MIPEKELLELGKEIDGEYALYVSVPDRNERFAVNENRRFYSASTIKVPLLCLLFQDAEQGRVDLNRKVPIRPENRCGGSGILQSLNPDVELSLFDLAELMISLSDNIATNEIISIAGMERFEQFCRENRLFNTWLWAKMMEKTPVRPAHLQEDEPINAFSAGDMGILLEKMASGTIVSEAACKKMIQIMATQQKGRLKSLLPCANRMDPYAEKLLLPAEGKVVAATKGGTKVSQGSVHDAGIFYLPDGRYYIMSVFTKTRNAAETSRILEKMGRVMYEAMI